MPLIEICDPASTASLGGFFNAAGRDQGNGTAVILVAVVAGANSGIVTSQTTLTAAAPAVKITSATPAATRSSVQVTNSGANTLWVGPSGVTAATGIPIASGASMTFSLGPNVALYGFSTSGSTAAVMEFA